MPVVNEFFDEFQGIIWLQPDGPNTAPQPFLCADTDGIDEPQGDLIVRLCLQADGSWKTVNTAQGSPGLISFDIVSWKAKQRNWLQKQVERRCPIPVYFHHAFCGRADVFLNYDQGKLVQDAIVTNKSYNNMVRRRADTGDTPEKTGQTFSLMAGPPAPEYYKLVETLTDADSEDEPLRDIAFCSVPNCVGPCGALVDECDAGIIGADAAAVAVADGYNTADNGATWAAWAAQPFLADEHICSVVCFDVDQDTTRWLVMRGTTDVGNPAEVAYSDDGGATWTTANVGSTNGEYGMHSGALFALDHRHIWACTDLANVYFSSDGGLTWTDQGAPTPGASESLYYIHFVDENYGWAVGGFPTTPTGLLIQTTDGGEHWALAATEPQTESCNWVSVIDAYRVWVGMDDGTVWYTTDWGTTWTQRVLPTTLNNTGDGIFIDAYCGFICGNSGSGNGYPTVLRTFDGGYSWESYVHATAFNASVTYYGLNALWVCSYNEVHAVGEQLAGGSSIIWTLKPEGW